MNAYEEFYLVENVYYLLKYGHSQMLKLCTLKSKRKKKHLKTKKLTLYLG